MCQSIKSFHFSSNGRYWFLNCLLFWKQVNHWPLLIRLIKSYVIHLPTTVTNRHNMFARHLSFGISNLNANTQRIRHFMLLKCSVLLHLNSKSNSHFSTVLSKTRVSYKQANSINKFDRSFLFILSLILSPILKLCHRRYKRKLKNHFGLVFI